MAVKGLFLAFSFAFLHWQTRAEDFSKLFSNDDMGDSKAEAAKLEEFLQKGKGGFSMQVSADSLSGTTGSSCPVSLPDRANSTCQEKRKKELEERRKFYRFTDPRNTEQAYPYFNVTIPEIVQVTMEDQELARWLHLNGMLVENTKRLVGQWVQGGHSKEIETFDQFKKIFDFFTKNGVDSHEFAYPWIGDADFISISQDDNWRHDRYFTDQRFSGANPLNIQKVTISGRQGMKYSDLIKKLNKEGKFWTKAVSAVVGKKMTLRKAVQRGLIYVLRYPFFDDAITMPDITNNKPTRHMMNTTSPIAIFALSRDGPHEDHQCTGEEERPGYKPFKMYPVAIQLDHTKDSPVFTPDSGDQWMLAKATVQMIDGLDSVLFQHVTKVHIVMETICLGVYRHFSEDHPLFQVLKQHCGPVLTLNTLSVRRIAADGGIIHVLTPVGSRGAGDVMNRGYDSISWKKLGYYEDLKKRGVRDWKLSYYPYRDDGQLIHMTIGYFAWHYTRLYYQSNADVRNDHELQAFLNDVSAKGRGSNGEKGQLKDFPSRIGSVERLSDLLSQIIWMASGRHAAVNYPTSLYFSMTPNTPTKMYTDQRTADDEFSAFRLPQENVVLAQVSLGMNVGTLRYDSLFDYGPKLRDGVASWLVKEYKKYLTVSTYLINTRNKRRFKQCHLSYPFLLPDLITNSVAS